MLQDRYYCRLHAQRTYYCHVIGLTVHAIYHLSHVYEKKKNDLYCLHSGFEIIIKKTLRLVYVKMF